MNILPDIQPGLDLATSATVLIAAVSMISANYSAKKKAAAQKQREIKVANEQKQRETIYQLTNYIESELAAIYCDYTYFLHYGPIEHEKLSKLPPQTSLTGADLEIYQKVESLEQRLKEKIVKLYYEAFMKKVAFDAFAKNNAKARQALQELLDNIKNLMNSGKSRRDFQQELDKSLKVIREKYTELLTSITVQ